MNTLHKALAGVFAAAAMVSGTTIAQVVYDSTPRYVQTNPAYVGTIESIDSVRAGNEGNKAAGTILGGVIGGVIGHQFGSGRGNDAATVAGALGGAAVGHEIAEDRSGRDGYRINVRLDNGGLRSFFEDNVYGLNVGDRVRIENDHLYRFAANERYEGRSYYVEADPTVRYLPNGRLDRRVYRYDSQGYRVDQWGNRYDAEGYWVDERGIRQPYQDPPMDAYVPNAPRNPQ